MLPIFHALRSFFATTSARRAISSASSSLASSAAATTSGAFDPSTAIDFMKAIAVLGSKAPDVVAAADEASDEDALDMARRADVVAKKLRNAWKIGSIQQELMLDLSLTTTTFIYTPWV